MKSRIKRIEIGLIILVILTIINTTYNFLNYKSKTTTEKEKVALPKQLNRELLNKTTFKIKDYYNNSNWSNLYNIFGEFAKAQINTEDVIKEFKKLSSLTGYIGTYAYSHYTYLGNENDADWFDVYYKCSFSNGNGTIKIRYRVVEPEDFEIVGLNINLDEI
ncbi:hypothetical protein [Tenacibaculum caenipelagi]|uniref:Uncharacterized protein n=1 Tax=Tenacibaculum caenipelagi TaxID=1325435 RepID=A0A4R6TIF0_9FLAO|nr:hypothetical protein [Tenacibaculum caenipelagi]TDQ30315.1 hypothetical protein DFQ07_0657 [Tenacibaculum caenipelagi]